MDFDLSEEQRQLQDELRRMLAARCTTATRRAAQDLPGAVDRDLWRHLADTGVFALRLPEADGGIGLGLADASVVFEELGRAAVPGPVVWTSLAAGLVDGAATGEVVVGGLVGGGPIVEHLDGLDVLLVLDASGVRRVDPRLVDATPVERPLDPLTPVHVAELPDGDQIAGADVAATWHRDAAVLVGSLQVGLGAAAVDLATAYAMERHQFGRPIGSFQAVAHRCVDMRTELDACRYLTLWAAWTLDAGAPADLEVGAAKSYANGALRRLLAHAHQVHGAVGFSTEHDLHLFTRRAKAFELSHGTTPDALERVAVAMGLG